MSVSNSMTLNPIQRRLLAEDLVRLRRPDEQRRYASSQRQGRVDPNPHQIDAVVFAFHVDDDAANVTTAMMSTDVVRS